ncbi:MAG TPA: chemotaxis response regulator protein-glutamate methylesterase [Methylomirabilota bacterium]|jgi:two-component system chemotaxis response regulator CheB|nr:chemotaxis response regulator protein-glutamate methylesterase [Methylomirabilota bacterium]
MRKIRVLVVDDSVVIRKIVTDALGADPDIEVVGVAANGRIALAKLPHLNPDLVTLDIEMPEMDGLQTLAALRKAQVKLPVIMFSTLTQRGASATLDALALGASDYVTKPANVGNVMAGMQRIRDELIPKVKTFCAHLVKAERKALRRDSGDLGSTLSLGQPAPPGSAVFPSQGLPTQAGGKIEVVAIGVSTGGPNALAALFPQWPASFPVPIVVVQHMPPMFTKLLADRLSGKSAVRVSEGQVGMPLLPAQAIIAPGDFHMLVEQDTTGVRVSLRQGPPENSCRPAVDVLFRSVAHVFGPRALGVVLTGMGQDGLRGCEAIKAAGGQVFVQDEASSVVWGMPGIVAKAGLADKILPLDQLGIEILRRAEEGRMTSTTSGAKSPEGQVHCAAQQR